MDEEKQTVAQKIMFSQLCEVFAEMKNKQKDGKRFIFERFLRKWREEMVTQHSDGFVEHRTDDTFFPAMRLFVPSKDQSRNFQIRNAKLNVLVAGALNVQKLDKKYEDRKEVLIDKLVSKSSEYYHVETPKLSIAEVNECLDRIEPDIKKTDQEKAMNKLCRHCTTKELHWIFHIILEDVEQELGNLSAHTIMEWFHPGSDCLWKEGNSLLQICEQFSMEETYGSEGFTRRDLTGNLLCKPFRPMLLKRLDFNKYCLPKIIKFCQRPFYVEVKYDGEHLLVHKYGGINYKYYTRNGNDYTHKMGATNEMLLSKCIHPFFKPEVKDCVLDCELLIWDRKKQEFVGKNKRASDGNIYDPKHLDEDFFKNHTQFDRSLAVFDVLYLNDRCLLKANLPLKDRLEVLGRIFKEEDRSFIFVSPKHSVKNAEDFVNFYKKSMREGEEGIVVKGQNSLYRPGARAEKNGWFKIKPDYGAQSTMDLAVVGVRFENAQLSHIKSFLVAARQTGRHDQLHFRIVAGITSKLKALDYQRLRTALGEKEDLLEERPEWLKGKMVETQDGNGGEGSGSRGGGPWKFDRFVLRENIKVVEVRASGLLNGQLQFPSIVSVRSDKSVDEIDSVKDVYQFDERLRSRPIIANESDLHEANVLLNRKKRLQLKLKKEFELVKTNTTEVGRFGRPLEGKKICVLNANGGVSTQDLQKILIQFGATPIALPNTEMAFAIAMDPKKMTCGSQIKANRVHIVKGEWLLRCKEEKRLLPWKDEDMIHQCPTASFQLFTILTQNEEEVQQREENGEEMTSMEDEEGEERPIIEEGMETNGKMVEDGPGYSGNGIERENEENGSENSDTMVQLVKEAEKEEEKVFNELAALNFNEFDCQPVEAGNLFADFIFHLHESIGGRGERNSLRNKIEQQNGRISNELNASVTHVVVGKMRSGQEQSLFEWNEWQKQFNGQFVGTNWVDEAIEEEDRYRMQDRIHEFIEY